MKTMKIYRVFLEDNADFTNTYSVLIPAFDKEEAMKYCVENEESEVVAIKDVTENYIMDSITLAKSLSSGIHSIHAQLIVRILKNVGLCD